MGCGSSTHKQVVPIWRIRWSWGMMVAYWTNPQNIQNPCGFKNNHFTKTMWENHWFKETMFPKKLGRTFWFRQLPASPRRVPQPNQSRGARWRSNSRWPQGMTQIYPMKILLIQKTWGKYDKIRRDVVSGFLVNFQAFVELFLSIFQNFSYQNSYDPILDSIQHSLYEIIKNRVSQSFSKECGFSHDFQLPAAPPYSADSAKTMPCGGRPRLRQAPGATKMAKNWDFTRESGDLTWFKP